MSLTILLLLLLLIIITILNIIIHHYHLTGTGHRPDRAHHMRGGCAVGRERDLDGRVRLRPVPSWLRRVQLKQDGVR